MGRAKQRRKANARAKRMQMLKLGKRARFVLANSPKNMSVGQIDTVIKVIFTTLFIRTHHF